MFETASCGLVDTVSLSWFVNRSPQTAMGCLRVAVVDANMSARASSIEGLQGARNRFKSDAPSDESVVNCEEISLIADLMTSPTPRYLCFCPYQMRGGIHFG